jgi:hypothetical protein
VDVLFAAALDRIAGLFSHDPLLALIALGVYVELRRLNGLALASLAKVELLTADTHARVVALGRAARPQEGR